MSLNNITSNILNMDSNTEINTITTFLEILINTSTISNVTTNVETIDSMQIYRIYKIVVMLQF